MSESTDIPRPASIAPTRDLFGHPRGLVILFFAEMWERFSYYGMRALLVFYLTWHFLFERDFALTIYGAYVALVYLGPLLGGYMADRYLGFRKAVIFGALLLVAGHGLMGLHGAPSEERIVIDGESYQLDRSELYDPNAQRFIIINEQKLAIDTFEQPEKGSLIRNIAYTTPDGEKVSSTGALERQQSPFHTNILFLALALIVGGVGFLKPNISTCVGALYEQGDQRRDAGFTIYYMGINIGAFTSSLLCGWLGVNFGWAYGFGAAAVGMLLGLIVFVLGQGWLEGKAEPPEDANLKAAVFGPLNREMLVYLSGLAFVAAAFVLLQIADVTSLLMHGAFALVSLFILIYMLTKLDAVERDRMIGLFILILSSILFWTLFDQGPSSLNFFAAAHVDTGVFNAPQLQSLNPGFIILFAIPVAILWTMLGKRGKEPNAFVKFGLGLVQCGLGFFVLNLGIQLAGVDAQGNPGQVALIWVTLMYLLHTTGELFLSPVGLSSVTKLSLAKLVGFMMGYWFFATSYANIIAAQVAKATQVPEGAPAAESIALYNEVYFQLGMAAVGLGLVLLVLSRWLGKLSHGRG